MTSATGRREEPTRGRKRDSERTAAILSAARDVLWEVGYDNLRIQDVAERACSGTGAIYRRWNDKDSLIAEAIRTGKGPDYQVSDDAMADIADVVRGKADMAVNQPDLLPGLMSAMRSSEAINDAVLGVYTTEPIRDNFARLLGEDYPHLDILGEMIPAIMLQRMVFDPEPVDADEFTSKMMAFITDLVEAQDSAE
jgi:AcrR family transcriptional regulator